jgi:hypothetical protein
MMLGSAGCADEVVGQFAATIAMGGSGGASGDSSSADAGTSVGSGSASTGDASSEGTTAPPLWDGGCYGDDFEDSLLDDTLWWGWVEGDAAFNETAGWMKFDPSTTGLFDTGLVTKDTHRIAFDNASSRMQITVPPVVDRPVAVFLQIIAEPAVLSVSFGGGVLSIGGTDAQGVSAFQEEHPELGTPAWVGIRAEEPNVHFEVSADGITWTTFATFPKPDDFTPSRPLIMVQTYGDYPDRMMVAVDNFETCVD